MDFKAACATTAMGIMPHKNVEQALALALSLDIPFWPQLPRECLGEDMSRKKFSLREKKRETNLGHMEGTF